MKIPCERSCRDYIYANDKTPFCGFLGRPAGEECMAPAYRRKLQCESCRQACKHDACPWWGGNNG